MKNNGQEGKHSELLAELYGQLTNLNPGLSISTVLVGSASRGTETYRSDIDVLILSDKSPKGPSRQGQFHLHLKSNEEFLKKLREGDDFAAWCVRYGLTIQDTGHWSTIKKSPEASMWPDWSKKILHATRRLVLANTLLETGDGEATHEEALNAAGHVARALLLRSQVFPLSRAELPAQVKNIDYPHLALILEALLGEETSICLVKKALAYSKKLLCHLDPIAYHRLSAELGRGMKKRNPKETLYRARIQPEPPVTLSKNFVQ